MIRCIAIVFVAACSTAGSTARPHAPVTPTDTTVELAARRAPMIGWLHDYGEAGAYPTDLGGQPLSVFRDANGVRCPMAELIHKSGRDDLVDAVVAENNAVRLADVHDGPLHDWMISSGLTEQEIAMVQGAMNINMMQWRERAQDLRLAAAQAEIKGKLEVAEVALRDATATSLVAVTNQLAERKPHELAVAKILDKVVPKSAFAPVQHAKAPTNGVRIVVQQQRTSNGFSLGN